MNSAKNGNKTIDPEEFARKMLWNICGVRAEVRHLHMQTAQLFAVQSGDNVLEVQKKWKKTSEELQKKIYAEACE